MRIAFLTHAFPYPVEKDGHTVIAHYLLKELSQRHKIALFCFGDKNDRINLNKITDYGIKVDLHQRPIRTLPLYYLSKWLKHIAWFQYRLYTKAMVLKIKELDNSSDYDLIYVHSPYMSAYLKHIKKKPVVFSYIDALSSWYQQFNKVTRNPLKKIHYMHECRMAKLLEKNVLPSLKSTIVVSKIDAEIINRLSPKANITVIPNGVDLKFFRLSTTPPEPNTIIFSGTMNYPPNVKAVLDFNEKAWPKLKKMHPDIHWTIVGKNPTLDIFELQSHDSQITVTGYVKDIRTYIWRSAIYVSPLSICTGFKNIIIEAMACGKAVVASSVSLTGFPIIDRENVMVANSTDEFVEKISFLLANPEKRQRMEKKAQDFAKLYDWNTTVNNYEKVMEQAISHD
ncbi:glycosyltransferase family 4 protein [Patescibacteria group bacterium]|nr:glycosyltransferase family 4 protein [Patescibacteria group bacterium]MBU1890621.1 glycosyltransferase family 4 protein [Patescibacteria group bacterium]